VAGAVDATKKMYVGIELQPKEHVEKARPHYEKHVVVPLDKATAAVAGAVDATKKMYGGIELQFRNTWIISFCDDLREKRGLEVPNTVTEAF
jgi:hypothetical protein